MKKRILSLLLVCAMLVGLLPVFALLAGANPAEDTDPKDAVLAYADTANASEATKQIIDLLPWVYLTEVAALDLSTNPTDEDLANAANADLAAYIALASLTEEEYNDLYVQSGLAFQADFFRTNAYWNETITLSNVADNKDNDLTQFISYSKDPASGYLYVHNASKTNTVTAHDGYLDLSGITNTSSYGLMFNQKFTAAVGNGYSGLTYSYVAAPKATATNYLFGFAGMRFRYSLSNNETFLYKIMESNATVDAYSYATATQAGVTLANDKVTEFTATIRRYSAATAGVIGVTTGVSGNASFDATDVTRTFASAISASAVPTSRGSVIVPGALSVYQNGSSVYSSDAHPFFYQILDSTRNTVDENGDAFDTFDSSTQYYVKGSWTSASDPAAYRTYFTKDAEGEGYTFAIAPTSTNPSADGTTYYCYRQTGDTYYPVTINSFDDTSYGFITLYTKEGDDYVEVKQPTSSVTKHTDAGDTGWYNGFNAAFDSAVYAIRVYEREINAAEMAQNHFADVAKFYRLNVLDYLTLSEADKAAVHTAMMAVGLDDHTQATAQAALGAAIKAVYESKKTGNAAFDHMIEVAYDYAISTTLVEEILASKRNVSSVASAVTYAALAGKSADEAEALCLAAFDKAYYYDCYKSSGSDAADLAKNAFIDKAAEFGVKLDELYAIVGVDALEGTAAMYEDFMTAAAEADADVTTLQAIVNAYANLVLSAIDGSIKTEMTADEYNAMYVQDALVLALDFYQLNEYWGWTLPADAKWGNTATSILRDSHIQWSTGSAYAYMSVDAPTEGTFTAANGYLIWDQKTSSQVLNFARTSFKDFNGGNEYGEASMTADFLMKAASMGGDHRFQVADMRLLLDSEKLSGLGFNWGAAIPMNSDKLTLYKNDSASGEEVLVGNIDRAQSTASLTPLKTTPTLFSWTMTLTNPAPGTDGYNAGGYTFYYLEGNTVIDSDNPYKTDKDGQMLDKDGNVTEDASQAAANSYYQQPDGTMPAGKHDESVSYSFYYNGEYQYGASGSNANLLPGDNPWNSPTVSYIGYQGGVNIDLYAVRFYGKTLSAEEMAQNYFADLAKFYRLDLAGYDILTADEKLAVWAEMRAFNLSADREAVQAAYTAAVYRNHYESLEGLSSDPDYQSFLALAAEIGVEVMELTILSETARAAAVDAVLAQLRTPVDAYPQNPAVVKDLLGKVLGAGTSTGATFTHDEYNTIYVHQDHLTSWFDFFQATPDQTETLLEGGAVTNLTLDATNSAGIVKAGSFKTTNHLDLNPNPSRTFGDGYLRLGATFSNIYTSTVVNTSGAANDYTAAFQYADYTLEMVVGDLTSSNAQWYQIDFLRPSPNASGSSEIKFGESSVYSAVHYINATTGAWTTNATKTVDQAISLMNDGATAKSEYTALSGLSGSTAHTFVTRLDKTLGEEIRFWKVEKNGSEYTATLISEQDARTLYEQMKAVDADIADLDAVVAGTAINNVSIYSSSGIDIGYVTLEGVETNLHVFTYDGRASYQIGVDTQTAFNVTDQLYSRQHNPWGIGSGMTGNIYSYRRYDIVLTDEELAQNHFADVAKYYGLDITLYLGMTDAQKADIHSAMTQIMVAGDAEEALATYQAAMFMALYEDVLILDSADYADYADVIAGDTDGSVFANRYNWFLQAFGSLLIDLSGFLTLAPEDALPLLEMVAYAADNAIPLYLDPSVARNAYEDVLADNPDIEDAYAASAIVSFEGYQIRLGDDAGMKAGIRAVFHYDEDAIAALEAKGLSVEVSVTVAGNAGSKEIPVYTTDDGFLCTRYEADSTFVVAVIFGSDEQTKAFLDADITFSADVKVSGTRTADSSDFSCDVAVSAASSFGLSVNASALYTAFYEGAIEVDALVEKVVETTKEASYKQITVNGLDLADFTIRYSNGYTEAEAQAVADAIYAVTGYMLKVDAMGAAYWPGFEQNVIYLTGTNNLYGLTHGTIISEAEAGMTGTMFAANTATLYVFAADAEDRANVGTWFADYLTAATSGGAVVLPTELVQN